MHMRREKIEHRMMEGTAAAGGGTEQGRQTQVKGEYRLSQPGYVPISHMATETYTVTATDKS